MGKNDNANEGLRRRIPGPLGVVASPPAGVGRPPSLLRGPLGLGGVRMLVAAAMGVEPLEIHLELSELMELNEVLEHAKSGIIKKGSPFAKDTKRPEKILNILKVIFRPLGTAISIRFGSGKPGHRFLKAAFAWGVDPDIGGVSAMGITRSKLGRFNRRGEDAGSPVTGYVFEGPIGNWIIEYLGGKSSSIENLFATVIAHELGHQLGLSHAKSPDDLMFGFGDGNREQRIKWLGLAQKRGLDFRPEQVGAMKGLLAKP
jgi:hypothetical protein